MKNMKEIRDDLADTLRKLKTKRITPAAANASANVAGKFLSTVKHELEFAKMTGSFPESPFLQKGELVTGKK